MIKKLEFVAKPWLLDYLDHKLTKPHTEGFYSGTQFNDVSYRKSKQINLGKFVKNLPKIFKIIFNVIIAWHQNFKAKTYRKRGPKPIALKSLYFKMNHFGFEKKVKIFSRLFYSLKLFSFIMRRKHICPAYRAI